jgi:hypothetical protein
MLKSGRKKILEPTERRSPFRMAEGERLYGFMPWVHFLPIVLIALYPAFL